MEDVEFSFFSGRLKRLLNEVVLELFCISGTGVVVAVGGTVLGGDDDSALVSVSSSS